MRKDKFRPFFFDVQSDENPFFEVFKVPKTKGIALDKCKRVITRYLSFMELLLYTISKVKLLEDILMPQPIV
ncbi:hypothetical protein ACREZ0_10485, partial [Streptococcus pneumoniae]